jgi:ABC-type lipoprotein export system ATPase subunit
MTTTVREQHAVESRAVDLMIEAHGVTKTYESGQIRVEALKDVDFVVARGEMVAIMGPSGCGKTTLLNCLSGLDTIDSGTIRIAGTELAEMSDNARTDFRAQEMGFIFQFYNLLPVLTAIENVELPLLVSGVSLDEARQRALEMLQRVGIAGHDNHLPSELSGGQRQRVTIARALVNNPAIVWADEPTGDLDSKAAGEIMSLIRTLNRTLKETFIIVTHDPKIGALCDRIVRMQDGRIIGEDIPGTSRVSGGGR